MTLVVNFFGGPGSGKSTTAAHVFAELKWKGINTELVTEYAKDKVWENSIDVLSNQLYVFGKQYHKLHRVAKHVDVIITDSPIILSLVYDKDCNEQFKNIVLYKHNEFINLNYFLRRKKDYNPIGRLQNEKKAEQLDNEVLKVLYNNDIYFHFKDGVRNNVFEIAEEVCEALRRE